jgi:hypothetical protein
MTMMCQKSAINTNLKAKDDSNIMKAVTTVVGALINSEIC